MNLSARGEGVRLRWGAVFAGAVLAIAGYWTGELLGSLISLIEPGESSAWSWLGSILGVALAMGGALAGGWIAARIAGTRDRSEGLLHGLLVWGLFGTASATLFAILGGNLALVAGATAGAVRLAIGFAMLGLLGTLLAALVGGTLGSGAGRGARPWRGERARMARPAQQQRTAEPGIYSGPVERGDVPPSVH